MNLIEIGKVSRLKAKENSPLILSGVASIGVFSTAYLAGKAAWQMAKLEDTYPEESILSQIKRNWKLYIPAAISGASTIGCIIGSNRIGAKKTMAAQTALAVSQQVYSEYKSKVIEEIGERKEQGIRDKIVEDRVKNNPPPSPDILLTGPGNVLCCELFTGRYFASDIEKLRKAQNAINAKALSQDYVTMWDFYYMIGLTPTSQSHQLGWKSTKLMELQFSTVLTEDERPCLAFDYNYTTPM